MAPKKGKEPLQDENSWRTVIEEAPLDEKDWSVKVILIEGAGSDQDRIYLSKFETFAAEERRFVVKNICKTETVFMINQLGSEKKVKDESLRVFEEGNAFLKDKKDIPPDMFALIIKYLILKLKDEYIFIKGQRLTVREGMRRESATMLHKSEVKPTVTSFLNAMDVLETAATSGPSSKRDEVAEPNQDKKFNTLLRERGEEWRDKVYVDDFPLDGPNLYVAITGFVEPYLPVCLVKIGIPLTAVVQIRIDPLATQVPSSLYRATKRGQSQTELLTSQATKFWEVLQMLRIQEKTADCLKNTAFIVFSPPYWATDALSGEPTKIYDELCYLMYDIQDLHRQHAHYLENMDIINIPESLFQENDQTFYHELIDDIPLECVTIYSVIDSILATVCHNQIRDEDSKSSLLSGVTTSTVPVPVDTKSDNIVKEVFRALCNTDQKKEYRLTYGKEYESHKDPNVIKYGDIAKYKTFHLGNLNLDSIVFSSLFGMPIHNLWLKQDRPTDEQEAKINFHINVLLSCFNRQDVETSELNRLLHTLACRKLYNNRSSLKKRHLPPTTFTEFKKHYLKRSILAEPLPVCSSGMQVDVSSPPYASMTKTDEDFKSLLSDSPPEVHRVTSLFECPDISELVSAAEISANQPMKHLIDDFDYFEDFSGITAFQVLCDAFNKFNCVDYKYCEVTDCFILMFFNSHNSDGIARDEWRSHLSTPICLQDFFDFVFEEDYDWIQDEERAYDKDLVIKEQSVSKDMFDGAALKSCVEYTDVDRDMLMEGSLKYNEIIEAETFGHDQDESDSYQKVALVSPTTATTFDDKGSKKTKSPTSGSKKSTKRSIEVLPIESLTCIEIPSKPFLGYDLGDRRVEIFGKNSTYFSKDGTKISSAYSLIIPMNLEYIILNITPGNTCNAFWVHKAIGEFVNPEILDCCESFRITTKDEVMINIKKQTYEVPCERISTTFMSAVNLGKKSLHSTISKITEEKLEKKHFHSLFITWPNGMIAESVHEKGSPAVSHIKQYHINPMPNLDESKRCISLNGEVIIFKNSGDIEVLKPDGTYVNIKECNNKVIIKKSDKPQEAVVEVPDKGKKSKNLLKGSKAALKQSKNELQMDEVQTEPVQYELEVEEFESIDTDGLKQLHVNNTQYDKEKLVIRTATDYCLGEIFSRRMDGTSILLNKDGILSVTYPNKTRIVTQFMIDAQEIYPEWTDEEKEVFGLFGSEIEMVSSAGVNSQKSEFDSASSKKIEEEESKQIERTDGYICIYLIYTVEHFNFSTVTINKYNGNISIDSPNETTVVIDEKNQYSITLDPVTSAIFDGTNLHISYEACPKCKSYTTCDVKIIPVADEDSSTLDGNWVKSTDSFGKAIVVNEEGNITLVDESFSSEKINREELLTTPELPPEMRPDLNVVMESAELSADDIENDDKTDLKSESSLASHGKCRELYLAKTIRFFVLKRELTCSELIHRTLIDHYKRACRWQPWCSINHHDTFGDHRSMVSILTPVHLTETEKWLMDSKLADKPKYLTFKDLKPDSGKGFYHWMRPYERYQPKPMKPENVLPPRQPRAFILRTLEKQWGETRRDELKGARELTVAILRYRAIIETESETLLNEPIIDSRLEDERRVDDMIQAIAHRIYEDLRERMLEDIQKEAKLSITTDPLPRSTEERSAEGEETVTETKAEDATSTSVAELEQVEKMSPNLARYWRRRAEESREEEFFKYLLRERIVPPYFRNILGGAIWWEMNNMADEAVAKAERRKMMCVCAEEKRSNASSNVAPEPYM